MNKKAMVQEIVEILNRIENEKIIEYIYNFVRTVVTMWK